MRRSSRLTVNLVGVDSKPVADGFSMKTLLCSTLAVLALGALSCGTTPACPSSCAGCCDAQGACQDGTTLTACGGEGLTCSVCVGQEQCVLGQCRMLGGLTDGGSPTDAGSADAGTMGPRCTATAPTCQDQSVQQLPLFDTINTDLITEEGTVSGQFQTYLDAKGGGLTPTKSYNYARFTQTGLQKVDISDETALTSLDWDIAVRRYVIRINSGVSGPSCVEAARTAPNTSYETLTRVPAGLAWRTEAYFTQTCDYVPDTSGIGAPGTALSSYWTYSGCVQMTGNVFVVHLRDGRYVKLQVLGFYDLPQQAECDSTGSVAPGYSGNVRIRWAFIDAPAP